MAGLLAINWLEKFKDQSKFINILDTDFFYLIIFIIIESSLQNKLNLSETNGVAVYRMLVSFSISSK